MVFRNIQWFMDWWFNCVAIEYGYPGENPTLLSRSPASSEIKTTFVIFSHSKTKFRTMAARIGKYSGCSQRRFRLVFCYYWVLQICLKNLCKSQAFSSKYFYGPRWRIKTNTHWKKNWPLSVPPICWQVWTQFCNS